MTCRRAQVTQKKRAKQRKKREEQLRLRSDIERMLAAMGLDDLVRFTRMPDECLHWLKRPKPVVLPAPDQAHDPRLSQLACELKRRLDRVTVTVRGIDVTFNDFWSIGLPLANSFIRDSSSVSIDKAGFSSNILRHVSEFKERHVEFFNKYEDETIDFLSEHSGFDASLYSARRVPPSVRFPTLGTILSKHAPETASIVVEGARRKAYRCGAPENLDTGGITWVSWEPEPLGWGKGRSLPVFIQTHAIKQAMRRLRIPGHKENRFQYLMWESLRTPRLTPLDERGFLVDLRVNGGKRVGYLVGTRLPDRVLIKTFLLPTMRGTPESRELYRRLKLRRPDIEHLGLDDIGILVATDILRDPEIAKIFEECGFGDFLKVVFEDYWSEIRGGHSKRFKAYLGLESAGADQLPVSSPSHSAQI